MNRFHLDLKLILPSLILFLIGLVTLGGMSMQFLTSQLIFFGLGLIAFYFFSNFDYLNHKFLMATYFWGGIILLVLPFIFGAVTRGSVRWIPIGSFTLQPSEIIKPFLIVGLAFFISRYANKLDQGKEALVYLGLLLLPAFLIFKQPDLGSALVVASIWLIILLVSKAPKIFLTVVLGLFLLALPLSWRFLEDYQRQRLVSFVNPYADTRASGYQLIQSVIAVGSGGFWGRGLGHGLQSQLKFLPERQTDFIFATIAEELGFVGVSILLVTYGYLLSRLISIARTTDQEFAFLIVVGVFGMMFFQGMVNIGMNLGLMPITGITLPLVSAGGSSLIATMMALGIVHNISSQSKTQESLEIK